MAPVKRRSQAGHAKKPVSNKKRGKAEPLLGAAWAAFLQHLANTGPTWALIAISLAHLLCCRITEILRLQLQDIQWDTNKVRVRELKGHAEMLKPLSRAAVLFLEKLKAEGGRKISRTRMWGSRGLVTFMDCWKFPLEGEGHLFPASRKDCATPHRNKDAMAKAIRTARKSFVPPPEAGAIQVSKIRSHSARHRCINDLKQSGTATSTAMRFSRIRSCQVFNGYGQQSEDQIAEALLANANLQQLWLDIYS
ncbi:unnamed protein product [Symbiodinium sp. CCMP2592]|nr:unnamed protein product [Symbiodinium sp. CCMP2592]CAE6967966.1 unnamed protein product [Symbiodinium sp. CCMP2592]CAE7241445.1 unnamed protein product [Symbiodinium sp. CCMP2592]